MSVSEPTPASPSSHEFEAAFIDLLESSGTRDAGIASFEQEMNKVEDLLRELYIGKKPSHYADLKQAQEDLNAEWIYYKDVAVVTGRVYMAEADIADAMPAEWGEPLTDEFGDRYFFLEDVKLRSHGIDILPRIKSKDNDTATTDEEEGVVFNIRVGYSFSDANDDRDLELFTAFPGDLSRHEYSSPTPEEAESRLERQWPAEYHLIEELLKPDMKTSLPVRLQFLTSQLQKQLVESMEFRTLAAQMVDFRIGLDQKLPYVVTVERQISAFGGENPFDEEDEGDWMDISIKGPLTTLLYEPGIFFGQVDTNSPVYARFLGMTYNEIDGLDPEYVSIMANNVSQFRGTRAFRSILEKAMLGAEDITKTGSPVDGDEFESAINASNETPDVSEITVDSEEEDGNTPSHIREMMKLEQEFTAIVSLIQEAQKINYTTYEEAMEAARLLVSTKIRQQLEMAGIVNNYLLDFSGSSVVSPRRSKDIPGVSENDNVFMYGVDQDNPYEELSLVDTLRAQAESIRSFVREHKVIDSEEVVYRVSPSLLVNARSTFHQALTWQEVGMATIHVQEKAAIPLDGSADIKIVELEKYRRITESLQRLQREQADSPIYRRVMKLFTALSSSPKQEEPSILEHVKLINRLDADIRTARADGLNTGAVMDVLEALFVERVIGFDAEVFARMGDEYISDFASEGDLDIFGGTVADIRDDLIDDKLVFVIQIQNGELRYVAAESVRQFSFF